MAVVQLTLWAVGLCQVPGTGSEGLENAGHSSLPSFYFQGFSSPASKIFSAKSSFELHATLSSVLKPSAVLKPVLQDLSNISLNVVLAGLELPLSACPDLDAILLPLPP